MAGCEGSREVKGGGGVLRRGPEEREQVRSQCKAEGFSSEHAEEGKVKVNVMK